MGMGDEPDTMGAGSLSRDLRPCPAQDFASHLRPCAFFCKVVSGGGFRTPFVGFVQFRMLQFGGSIGVILYNGI